MKRMVNLMLLLLLVMVPLTACGAGGQKDVQPGPAESGSQAEGKTIHGTINRIGDYLVLVTEEGEHQVMDFGEGVTADGFAEGDSVDVTYTGELGDQEPYPVITAIAKSK